MPPASRIKGLDTVRFFLAMWVVFGHAGGPPIPAALYELFPVRALYNNLFPGPAAVIAFFVLSGLCIHYPYARTVRLDSPLAYYSRRYVRILTPMALAILLASPLGLNLSDLNGSILWSLVCEEIYYALYPALLFLRRRLGWGKLLVVSSICALCVVLTNPSAGNYPSYGPYLNWLLGLPCWLLGCLLAERVGGLEGVTAAARRVWLWRFGALGLGVLCSALRFHSPLTYPWTLNLFAVYVYFWLRAEIVHRNRVEPNGHLERAGRWSYSLYLTHLHANALVLLLLPGAWWLPRTTLILAAAYLFYRAVEKPSHNLARRLGRKLARPAPRPHRVAGVLSD